MYRILLYELVTLSKTHLQQIIRTSLVWSGCSPFSYTNPLSIIIYIDQLKVEALVDTGADYDAIDGELAELLVRERCPSFVSRTLIANRPVSGFTEGLQTSTKAQSTWKITLSGAPVFQGTTISKDVFIACYEFASLSDPLIIGMPSIDEYGGLEVVEKFIWYADLWIPRHDTTKRTGSVASLRLEDVPLATSGLKGCRPPPAHYIIDDKGWYVIPTYWSGSEVGSATSSTQPSWLTTNERFSKDVEVVETAVLPHGGEGCFEMDVLVRAVNGKVVKLSANDRFCCLRAMTDSDVDALRQFEVALVTRESEDVEPGSSPLGESPVSNRLIAPLRASGPLSSGGASRPTDLGATPISFWSDKVSRPTTGPLSSGGVSRPTESVATLSSPGSDRVSRPTIGTSRYKLASRTDEQARLFPDLELEIEERRKRSQAPVRDQTSKEYKDDICAIVKQKQLCPAEHLALVCKHILRPFSDRFWDEGCPAPTITGFKAHIDLKPDAKLQLRQPYRLSKFDETRLRFLYEEAEREGKVERYTLGERPPCVCTPVIVVDKKGSLIGRKVGDFRSFNLLTMDYYYPAPDADMVLMEACGKRFHSLFDCVWGFEQIDLDDSTAELCSTITPFGVFKSKKLPMGVKQGPGIYQHMQDNAFQCEYKESGEKLCNAFFDDTHIGDFELTEHIQSVTRVLTIARRYNIQYRLSKCEFFKPEVLLLGFLCSAEGRKADPRKIEQLKAWPEYTSVADINSHLAFANYLREYLGPDYSERAKPLRAYQKKGANFADFAEDKVAQEARLWLKSIILENCVLVLPDFVAASRPWHSGRPFEAFLDASDESWCVALCQRSEPAGCPRIIAFICKSFTDEATRWSAFEREYYCFKEGYAAISKYVTGFTLFMYFDHKNIERAESVLTSRRASKKLVNWIADTQHILANVVRLWIDGKNNILADCGSRLPWHTSVSKHLPVPAGPIRDVIRLLFTHPHELEKLVQGKANEMGLGAWQPALPTDASSIDPERSTAQEGYRSDVSRPIPSQRSESLGRPGRPGSGPAGGRDAIPEDVPVPDGFTEASEEFLDVQSSYSWQEHPVPQTPDSSDDWIDVPVPPSSGSEGSTTVPGAPISSASSSVAVGRSTGDQVNSSRISRNSRTGHYISITRTLLRRAEILYR